MVVGGWWWRLNEVRDGRVGGRKCELERGSRKNSQYKEQVRNYKKIKKYFLKLKQKKEILTWSNPGI